MADCARLRPTDIARVRTSAALSDARSASARLADALTRTHYRRDRADRPRWPLPQGGDGGGGGMRHGGGGGGGGGGATRGGTCGVGPTMADEAGQWSIIGVHHFMREADDDCEGTANELLLHVSPDLASDA